MVTAVIFVYMKIRASRILFAIFHGPSFVFTLVCGINCSSDTLLPYYSQPSSSSSVPFDTFQELPIVLLPLPDVTILYQLRGTSVLQIMVPYIFVLILISSLRRCFLRLFMIFVDCPFRLFGFQFHPYPTLCTMRKCGGLQLLHI